MDLTGEETGILRGMLQITLSMTGAGTTARVIRVGTHLLHRLVGQGHLQHPAVGTREGDVEVLLVDHLLTGADGESSVPGESLQSYIYIQKLAKFNLNKLSIGKI